MPWRCYRQHCIVYSYFHNFRKLKMNSLFETQCNTYPCYQPSVHCPVFVAGVSVVDIPANVSGVYTFIQMSDVCTFALWTCGRGLYLTLLVCTSGRMHHGVRGLPLPIYQERVYLWTRVSVLYTFVSAQVIVVRSHVVTRGLRNGSDVTVRHSWDEVASN